MYRRNRRNKRVQNRDRWLISYADLITVLFAFFVVMYSASSLKDDSHAHLQQALDRAFTHLSAAVADTTVANKPGATGQTEIDASPANTARQIRRILASDAQKQLATTVTYIADRVEIALQDDLLFKSGQAQLTPAAIDTLARLVPVLLKCRNRIQVSGHTDNQPIHTERFLSNWELSSARAVSVVHTLIQQGLAPERLSATGYGEFQPLADNQTEAERRKNRRVVLSILYK